MKLVVAIAPVFLATTEPALAYMGPGSGLASIGSLVALIVASAMTLFGVLWFPIKRLLRIWRARRVRSNDDNQINSGWAASSSLSRAGEE